MTEGTLWQVLVDCPHCRTESAVVEWMDPSHGATAFGLPFDRRCRLCGWQQLAAALPAPDGRCPSCQVALSVQEGRCGACGFAPELLPSVPPADLTDPEHARAALTRWAQEEGEPELSIFCTGNFGAPPEEVIAKLARREPIPTTFDVIAYLFPQSSSGGPVQRAIHGAPAEANPSHGLPDLLSAPSGAESRRVEPEWEARTAARLLASVMVADGKLLASERKLLSSVLEREHLPPLSSADLRVWRPAELPPPADKALRGRLLEAAIRLMHVDGERDESEWRVIRGVARRWGLAEARLEEWDLRYEGTYGGVWRGVRAVIRYWNH